MFNENVLVDPFESVMLEYIDAIKKDFPVSFANLYTEITKKDFDWNNENDIIEIKMLKTIGYLLDFYFIKVGKNKIKSLKKQSAATGN
uniref:Uncharacterized protein n=1 Tax=Meloidogyne floridensis TaxID=298350 RepID=A0A915PEX4_9BILA